MRRCHARSRDRTVSAAGTHHLDGGVRVGPPGGVHGHRLAAPPGPQPVAHQLPAQSQRRRRAGGRARPVPLGDQRPVGHPDRGHTQHRPQVQRQPGAPWMVTPGGVDQQHLGRARLVQGAHGRLEQPALPQRQQRRQVGRAGGAAHHRTGQHTPVPQYRRRGERGVACLADPGDPSGEAHEAPPDSRRGARRGGRRRPRRRGRLAERHLHADQLVGAHRPGRDHRARRRLRPPRRTRRGPLTPPSEKRAHPPRHAWPRSSWRRR